MTFEKGQSGNPDGRPRGVKDRRTLFREMVEPYKDALVQKAISMALDSGNEQMLRLLLTRLLPAKPKDDAIDINLTDGTASEKSKQVIEALNNQDLTPSDAMNIMKAIALQAKIYETDELKNIVDKLEETLKLK